MCIAYSKAPIIRTRHSTVLAVHICTAELAYIPVRIIGTLEYPLTPSLLRHAVQLTTGRLKLDILMGGGHIGSPLARVHFERPATMLMYCISCPTYALQPIDFQEFSHRMT